MKKTILLSGMIFLSSFYLNAQQSTDTQKNYKWQIGLQLLTPQRDVPGEFTYVNTMGSTFINSPEYNLISGANNSPQTKDKTFSIGLNGNYFLKNNNFIHVRAAINKVDIEIPNEDWSDTLFHNHYTASKKRTDVTGAIGIGRFIEIKKMKFYAGFEMPVIFYGTEKLHDDLEVDDVGTGAFVVSYENFATFKNGFSFGLGSFAGFSFLFKNFSLGSEISSAFLFSKYGGEGTRGHINKYGSQNPDYLNLSINPSLSLFEFSKIKASINFTYQL